MAKGLGRLRDEDFCSEVWDVRTTPAIFGSMVFVDLGCLQVQ